MSAGQSIAENTVVNLSFPTTVDNDGNFYASGTPTQLTATAPGLYGVCEYAHWAANSSDGARIIQIEQWDNGTGTVIAKLSPDQADNTLSNDPNGTICAQTWMQVGDYVQAQAWQNVAATLNVSNARFSMVRSP